MNQSNLEEFNYNHSSHTHSDSRISVKSDYIPSDYSQFLCFSVTFSTNNLIFGCGLHAWTEPQQVIHDQIKSLHDDGMGYRRIAKHLNALQIKTIRGNEWENSNVHSVLKRNRERLNRLEIGTQESETEYGKWNQSG